MRILPDGSVEIRNKKTGATKIVQPSDLPSFGIPYSTFESELTAAKNVGIDTTAEVKKETKLDAGEKNKLNLAKTGLSSLNKVNDFYQKDPGVLTKQLIPGKVATRSFDSALFGAVDTLLRIRTGATAPEEEIRRYMSAYGPNFGDSPEDVAFKTNQLREALIAEGGIPSEEAEKLYPSRKDNGGASQDITGSIVPGSQEGMAMQTARQRSQEPANFLDKLLLPVAKGPVGDIADMLLGAVAPDVRKVADKSGRGQQVTAGEAVGAGGDVLATALPFLKLGKLGLAAKGALAGGVSGVTASDQTPGERVMEGGKQALIGGVLGGLLQGGGAAINKVKGNVSLKGIGASRDAAVEAGKNIKFSGDNLVKAANQYVKDDPLAQNVANKILPAIKGKELTLPELMRKIDVWNDAYTQAGRVGKSAEAGINNVLARAAKDLLKEKAPDVVKANEKFAKAYGYRKTASKVIPFAAGGLGLGAGGNILSDLILGNR